MLRDGSCFEGGFGNLSIGVESHKSKVKAQLLILEDVNILFYPLKHLVTLLGHRLVEKSKGPS